MRGDDRFTPEGRVTSGAAAVERRVGQNSARSRVFGFGSVFGKGLRDSRWAVLGVGLGIGLISVATASQVAAQFPTAADRVALIATSQGLPAVVRGLLGDPINVERLGGFLSWRVTNSLPVLIGLWSILALSGTLATEARRGSLDFLATAPLSRARIATEKAFVHVVGLAAAATLLALLTWLAGLAFARLPGDEIGFVDSLSHFAGVVITSLVPGAVAFALAPVLGRVAAAGDVPPST
jgi:ABC-2 type transport system permease protein